MTAGRSHYRRGVIAVILNRKGKVLVFERSDRKSEWQFPQGGLELGESAETTLRRELQEEIGTADVEIFSQSRGWIRYEFPKRVRKEWRARGGKRRDHLGQEQRWYLCRFKGRARPRLSQSDGTFTAWEWVEPAEAIRRVVVWKQAAYQEGLAALAQGQTRD